MLNEIARINGKQSCDCSAADFSSLPAEQEKIDPRDLKYKPNIFLIGYSHGERTGLPVSMVENIDYFKKLGFNYLVLEARPDDSGMIQLKKYLSSSNTSSLRGGTEVDEFMGKSYTYMVKTYQDAGFKIVYGDAHSYNFDVRNEHFIKTLDEIVKTGGKPLLVIGGAHISAIAKRYYEAGKAKQVYPYDSTEPGGKPKCRVIVPFMIDYHACQDVDAGMVQYFNHENF